MMNTNDLLNQLRQPFPPADISWKPGASKGDKCMGLCYADFRAYQERLDEVMGLDWSVRYMPWSDGSIICELTLYVGDALGRREGITRSSTGESDAQDEKNNMSGSVSEAMAFKRACAMFGLGRYLYELPAAWVAFDAAAKKISKEGQNELDKRYRDWYQKTVAAAAKRSAPVTQPPQAERQVDAETGEIVQSADNPFTDEPKETPPHKRLWAIGIGVFGKDWDMARAWLIAKWTAHVTPDNTRNSAADLADDEKSMLGDYMNENIAGLQKAWPKQKAIILQASAA